MDGGLLPCLDNTSSSGSGFVHYLHEFLVLLPFLCSPCNFLALELLASTRRRFLDSCLAYLDM